MMRSLRSLSNRFVLLSVLLFVIGIGLYAVDLTNVLFLDDTYFIVENKYVHEINVQNVYSWFTENAMAGAGKISDYYRPLLIGSFAVNYAIHGTEPFGYLLTNNILHAVNAVLVFALLYFLLPKRWLAFLAALVFLVHPMQSENVAYVAGRGDLLGSFFMLAGLIVLTWGVKRQRYVLSTILSSIFLILALLSRENGIVFPFLAIVLHISFLTRAGVWRSLYDAIFLTLPHIIIVVGYFALRLTELNFRNFLNFGDPEVTSVYIEHISVRMYTFLHVLLEYTRTFLWPTNVHERFTFPIHESFFDWPVWFVFFVLVGLISLSIIFYRCERNGEHATTDTVSDFRMWFFAWGWFFVALTPASGIVPTNVIIQDHRLYLAMISISVLGLWYARKVIDYARSHGYGYVQPIAIVCFSIWLCFISWITFQRAVIWGKPIELFEETVRYEPDARIAYNSLGTYYLDAGKYKEAGENFLEAIKRGSVSPNPYYNMGYLLYKGPKKDADAAIPFFEDAITIDPSFRYALQYLADIYLEKKNAEKTMYYLEELKKLRPFDPYTHYNVAYALHILVGNDDEALRLLDMGEKLLENDPSAAPLIAALRARILQQ